LVLKLCTFGSLSSAFNPAPTHRCASRGFLPFPSNFINKNAFKHGAVSNPIGAHKGDSDGLKVEDNFLKKLVTVSLSISIILGSGMNVAVADTTASAVANYDGFADYAKDNQMEKSDVACFANKCGERTKALFSNPRGIKGVSCLGRCKGEQSCATRCFAEYGSKDLNNWLSCTIEDNECVKVPKNIDNSAENLGYSNTVKKFDPSSLIGSWYKTDGLNPNYDLFDCQSNKFSFSSESKSELDMDIFFRIAQPSSAGGGYWENSLTEHMVVDAENTANGRTMHTEGKMYGLNFDENWYIIGESD